MESLTHCILTLSTLIYLSSSQAGQTGLYPDKYNLIDPDPSCLYAIPDSTCCLLDYTPQCPTIYDGPGDVDVMAIHPNIQERTDYLMRNMARLFPDFYVDSSWGWGDCSGSYKNDCDKIHTTPTKPFYFMSEAVQAARWNSFSGATTYSGCRRGDSTTYPGLTCNDAQTQHYTCCLYCQYNTYGTCGFKDRTKGFIQLLFTANANPDVGGEGVWGGNWAFQDSQNHCEQVFNADYDHQGIGYYPDGGTTMVGIKDTDDWEDHVLPHGTHYDWDQDDYTFLLEVFGEKKDPSVTIQEGMIFLLYNGQSIAMTKFVGDYSSGFFRADLDQSDECEPYAFIVRDTTGNWWRLPEDERYYFATVDNPDRLVLNDGSANCVENHYFYTGAEWVANGGDSDNLENNRNAANGCVGCSKIEALEAVYNNRQNIPSEVRNSDEGCYPPQTDRSIDTITTPAPVTTVPTTSSTPTLATYLGCYIDSSSRRFEWGYQTVANHDTSVCVGLCIDGGYQYMGLQYDNECFCGNDLDYITSLGTRDPSGGRCGMNQQDTDEYNNYGCWGGAWTNCVYQIDGTPVPITPAPITTTTADFPPECPTGYERISDDLSDDIGGCGLEGCGDVNWNYPDIQSCAEACSARSDCKSFGWGRRLAGTTRFCQLHPIQEANGVSTHIQQILCKEASDSAQAEIVPVDWDTPSFHDISPNDYDDDFKPNMFGLASSSSIIGLLLLTNIVIINVLICVCYKWKTKKENYSKIKKVYFDDNDDITESEQEEEEAI